MNEVCPICKAPRKPDSLFCINCGYRFNEKHCPNCNNLIGHDTVFCVNCGFKVQDTYNFSAVNNPEAYMAPQPALINPIAQFPTAKPRQKRKGIRILIGTAVIIVILAGAAFATRPLWSGTSQVVNPALAIVKAEKTEISAPECSYEAPTVVRPALYQSTDYIVNFRGSSEEEKECLLTVEIPGVTQKYEQKITLNPQELKIKVRPPLIQGILKTMNISRESQIKVSLQDTETQKYIIQDSKPVAILSKYDMKWVSDDGSETYYQDICAWVTPESPKIKELLRNSVDQLSTWSNGSINAIVGYQQINDMTPDDITYYQVAAMFETLRTYYQVRYNATPISTSGKEAQQRIALPEDVISQKSGLCIETAVTMASAIEATGMHAMVLILPGHAQVAVETWDQSGEYFLIETTALTETDYNNIIGYLDKDQWSNYLENSQVTVIDVDLARKDGIKPME